MKHRGRGTAPATAPMAAITGNALEGIGERVRAFQARHVTAEEAAVDNEDAPVVQVVQLIITQGLRDRASDIHIEPHDDRVRVRFRVDGALRDQIELPGAIGPALVSRIKVLADLNIIERRRSQDGQIRMQVEDRDVDIRVSTAAVVGGEKVVLRLLDKSRPLFRLEQLGMPPDLAERYAALLRTPYGMVICAGPTGSGKTTTLYGSLSEIDTPRAQHHDDRGSGRVLLRLDQPDPDQRGRRDHLRRRAEVDPAAGSRT